MLAGHSLVYNGACSQIGVCGFFVLSSFLITKVINEVYPRRHDKPWFFANRCVRVLPTYFVCLIISISLIGLAHNQIAPLNPYLFFPRTLSEWLGNLLIVGVQYGNGEPPPLLLPTAWSLYVELYHYVIIALITGRSKWRTWVGLFIGLCITAYIIATVPAPRASYLHPYAHTPFFMLGSLLYHYRTLLKRFCYKPVMFHLIFLQFCLYTPTIFMAPASSSVESYAIMYLFSIGAAYSILCLSFASFAGAYAKLDSFLADLTYPLFLVHYPILWFMMYDLSIPPSLRGIEPFMAGIPLAITVSILIVLYVEIPIKKLRKKIREKCRPSQPAMERIYQ